MTLKRYNIRVYGLLLHQGRVLAEGTGEFLIQDEQARKFYLGEDFNM